MPNLTQHHSASTTKMLLLGDSGSGKTGSLISLIKAGYRLWILDFDDGLDYLANLVRQDCPELAPNVQFKACTEGFVVRGNTTIVDGIPTAFTNAQKFINNWTDGEGENEKTIGSIHTWGPKDVLVIDSLTFAARAALRFAAAMAGHSVSGPQWTDYGNANTLIENFLGLLQDPRTKCNVITTAHVGYVDIGQDYGNQSKTAKEKVPEMKAYPLVIGNKLPPKIPTFFNSMLKVVRTGQGHFEKRVIITRPQGILDLKSAAPTIPAELPIDTGLADYFNYAQQGDNPQGATNQ